MSQRAGARRRLLSQAVLGPPAPGRAEPPAPDTAPRAMQGTIVDTGPHLLVLDTGDGEPAHLRLTRSTSVWYGGRSGPQALQPGRRAIVRPGADGPVAERVWVDITRVTGTILSRDRQRVEVDGGPHRGRTVVDIPDHALRRVLVRHPALEPGYLMDVICLRSPDGPRAVRPGTSQPGHPAYRPVRAPADVPLSDTVRGTATWFDGPQAPVRGAAYPAVDPEGRAGGCADVPEGCAPLPYLSCGSELTVHNECSKRTMRIPVIECGCVAARYCDRCVECGTSPRGRIAELTPAAFVDLGGDLDAGCFNVTLGPAAVFRPAGKVP